MNIFLEPGQFLRVVGHDEPLKSHFLVREKYERPMLSQSGGWDNTFRSEEWRGTAWHTVEDELPAWVDSTYNEFNKLGHFHYEIVEVMDIKHLINIYMCGYGDRDAKLNPFVGGEPEKYIKMILEGLV
jgi:hypothetical protein